MALAKLISDLDDRLRRTLKSKDRAYRQVEDLKEKLASARATIKEMQTAIDRKNEIIKKMLMEINQ